MLFTINSISECPFSAWVLRVAKLWNSFTDSWVKPTGTVQFDTGEFTTKNLKVEVFTGLPSRVKKNLKTAWGGVWTTLHHRVEELLFPRVPKRGVCSPTPFRDYSLLFTRDRPRHSSLAATPEASGCSAAESETTGQESPQNATSSHTPRTGPSSPANPSWPPALRITAIHSSSPSTSQWLPLAPERPPFFPGSHTFDSGWREPRTRQQIATQTRPSPASTSLGPTQPREAHRRSSKIALKSEVWLHARPARRRSRLPPPRSENQASRRPRRPAGIRSPRPRLGNPSGAIVFFP